jgi:hypothetical protein
VRSESADAATAGCANGVDVGDGRRTKAARRTQQMRTHDYTSPRDAIPDHNNNTTTVTSVAGAPSWTSAALVLTVSSRVFTAAGQARYRRISSASPVEFRMYMGRAAQASHSYSAYR